MKRILKNKKVLLGVSGGIAAYKIPELIRTLKKFEAEVKVVLTENGAKFVSKYTIDVLTEGNVYQDMFGGGIKHIELAEWADILAIVPATYNIVGKIANGIADDLLTTIVGAFKKKKLIFPSMNTSMIENPIFVNNLKYLNSQGFEIIEPEIGTLLCGATGKGRLPDIEIIIFNICKALTDNFFRGKKIIITAGASVEMIDPVRVITNLSTGKMGVELAKAFALLGADVLLLVGLHSVKIPSYINVKTYTTSKELYSCLLDSFEGTDIFVMAAAVSDFIPEYNKNKIKRDKEVLLKLTPTIDILKEISKTGKIPLVVGFCLEDEVDILNEGLRKMKEKNCNVMVANTIETIGKDNSKGYLFYKDKYENFEMTKEELSWHLTNIIRQYYT